MKPRLLTGIIGAAILLSPLTFAQEDRKPSPTTSRSQSAKAKDSGMSEDMREAIAWEHAKDSAAARQARIEARRSGSAERSADRVKDDKGNVKDTKAPGAKRDQ
jgi:hypothetical protein